ncbi:MAG: HYR domain-containing protein [Saprospiraceae bacterium]|nr:HYR domain-containing protein [Saprospiraceae bacterium]
MTDTIASMTGGCDTIVTYTLELLPYNELSETVEFCPGASVTIGGVMYDQPGMVMDTIPSTTGGCDTIVTYTLELLPYNELSETVEFCPGASVTIGGVMYDQPGTVMDTIPSTTGGCDTIVTYTLELLPYNELSETVEFCPGASVTIGGMMYDQPGTVTDTIASTTGACDTIVTYTLELLPYNERSETVEFCLGETVVIGGNSYTQPGTVLDTIASTTSACDTIVTYTLQLASDPGSSVSITCSSDVNIATSPGTGPVAVTYDLPTATSDCVCPGIELTLTEGFPSGSTFPVTETLVCYQAKDSCGNTATCCFNVTVREEEPCDVKEIGCMKWELLSISRGSTSELTYEIRVTNNCSNKMIYTVIQVPDGVVAVEPLNNSVYTAPSGRTYDVRNPNYTPFYSIRYKSKTDSISNGQGDILQYVLPGNTAPAYIHIASRLYPSLYYEAHLNTFNCPIQQLKPGMKLRGEETGAAYLQVFPNPTTGVLYADLSAWNGQEMELRIFNSQGQQVRRTQMVAQDVPQQVDLPQGLASGLYFMEVMTPQGEKHAVRFVLKQ